MATSRRIPLRVWLLPLAAVVLLGVPSFAEFYLEWLWFDELGYQAVFLRKLTTATMCGAAVFTVAFLVLYLNYLFALTSIRSPFVVLGPSGGPVRPPVIKRQQLRYLALAAAVVGGGLLGLVGSSQWLVWLQYIHAVPFGAVDPILGRDAGFYVFTLPVLSLARSLLVALLGLALVGSAAVYGMAGLLNFTPRDGIAVGGQAQRHLSLLIAGFLLVLAFGAWLDAANLLITPAGSAVEYGASYADVEARLPALRILMVLSVCGALLAAYAAFAARVWPIVLALGLYGVGFAGGVGYAAALQRFVVSPNEQVRETPYIVHNIRATRRSFAIDTVEVRPMSGDATLTQQDIDLNRETIDNVRLWDHQPLLDTFAQLQEIRTYYDFVSVDNDRYEIDGQYRQVMLSARELNSSSLPNRTWINERLTFTHGYGLTLGPVNQVTEEGLPVLFIRDLPPIASTDLTVEQPSLYYGELTDGHVFVKTGTEEFHYPQGENNVFTSYDGTGGVVINSFFRRLMFTIGLRSYQLLFNTTITQNTRVLYNRQIHDRVRRVADFLTYDADPYLVVSEGRLFWIYDAYTTSSQYPYASPIPGGRVNYMRNAVKVVIDAYNGTTRFYVADPTDPLVLTLEGVFPELFQPIDEMSADLRGHLRYPETIFAIQSTMFMTYHMTNPAVFYNKEDQWEVPSIGSEGVSVPMAPYYTIMRLPGEPSAEFIQMLPLTPRGKDNLAAWMVARSDGDSYGKLMVFEFPKQKVVYGPRQIVARINQDQLISPQITLWNQQGSEVIQGTLLVIPIEESMLYIRPLYLRASGGRIPELNRVIVAYQDRIVMEATLGEALAELFGSPRPPAEDGASVADNQSQEPDVGQSSGAGGSLAEEALGRYQRALQAQRDGDWSRYGEEIRRVGELLEQLNRSPASAPR